MVSQPTNPAASAATPASASAGFTTLHYGGSQSPRTGRLGSKPEQRSIFRKLKRLETMVRLEAAGIGESAAAAMLCISVPRLRTIKKSSDYLQARIKITHGIILDQDSQLSLIKSQRREILTQMLPPALQILANELQRPAISIAERKHQTSLALELLDREGTFAKVSRTEVKPVDSFDFERADVASRSIINTIKGIAAPTDAARIHAAAAVSANVEFSNSHTLSAVDQQEALDALESASTPELDAEFLNTLPTDGTVN